MRRVPLEHPCERLGPVELTRYLRPEALRIIHPAPVESLVLAHVFDVRVCRILGRRREQPSLLEDIFDIRHRLLLKLAGVWILASRPAAIKSGQGRSGLDPNLAQPEGRPESIGADPLERHELRLELAPERAGH